MRTIVGEVTGQEIPYAVTIDFRVQGSGKCAGRSQSRS